MQTKQERLKTVLSRALLFVVEAAERPGWETAVENQITEAALICFGGKTGDSEAPK